MLIYLDIFDFYIIFCLRPEKVQDAGIQPKEGTDNILNLNFLVWKILNFTEICSQGFN